MNCSVCPRKCNKPRENGFCKIPQGIFVNKFMLHKWEEPVVSGKNGSGAVFFSGCNLRCCYCQNSAISHAVTGTKYSADELTEKIIELLSCGADNVNLVSPTPYSLELIPVLEKIKKITDKPIIFNTGGYDSVETLVRLRGLIDVYLPDFKYTSPETAKKYSLAPDYPDVAKSAIKEMLFQQPKVVISDGLIKKGVIVRHLVLPGHRKESIEAVRTIASDFAGAYISLMRQYTPAFNSSLYANLNRRVTSFEYEGALVVAQEASLDGFSQLADSADKKYTPDF